MTDRYTVMGNPIAHSMSPQIHAFFAQVLKDDLTYDTTLVPEGQFVATAKEFFKQGSGCNITVPCKLDAHAFAAELTPYAKSAGAVNTLKKQEDGSILGDNTDGRGFIADLKRLGQNVTGKKILVLGAGGAAQGVLRPLLEENPASVTLVNRTVEKAQKVAAPYGDSLSVDTYQNLKPGFDVIINATSSSLQKTLPAVTDDVFAGAELVYDLMYAKDGVTTLLSHCKDLGVKNCFDGFGMLICQAALAYELWRGVRPDTDQAVAHFRPQ